MGRKRLGEVNRCGSEEKWICTSNNNLTRLLLQIDRWTVRTNSDLEIRDIEIKDKRIISLPQLIGKHRQYSKDWREQHEKQLEDEKYHEQQDFSLLFLLVSALELPYPWIILVNWNYLKFQKPLNRDAIFNGCFCSSLWYPINDSAMYVRPAFRS